MKSLILPIILALSFAVVAQTPAAVERDILAQLKDVDKFGSYGDDSDEETGRTTLVRLRRGGRQADGIDRGRGEVVPAWRP